MKTIEFTENQKEAIRSIIINTKNITITEGVKNQTLENLYNGFIHFVNTQQHGTQPVKQAIKDGQLGYAVRTYINIQDRSEQTKSQNNLKANAERRFQRQAEKDALNQAYGIENSKKGWDR